MMKNLMNAALIALSLGVSVSPAPATAQLFGFGSNSVASRDLQACGTSQLNLNTRRALRDVGIRNADVCQLSRSQKVGITLAANSSGSFSEQRQRVKAILRR